MEEKAVTDTNRVEGRCLVIPTMTALPKRCVVTNEPVAEKFYTSWDLPFVRNWLVFLIFGPWMLLLAPAIVKRRCKIMAGVSAKVRHKFACLKAALFFVGVSPLAIVAVAIDQNSAELIIMLLIPGLLTMYFAVYAYVFYASPLKVAKFKDDLYWVRGCSTEFLASLEADTKK